MTMDLFAVVVAYLIFGLSLATMVLNIWSVQRSLRGLDRRNHIVSRVLTIFGCVYLMAIYAVLLSGDFGPAVPAIIARPAQLAILAVVFARSLE